MGSCSRDYTSIAVSSTRSFNESISIKTSLFASLVRVNGTMSQQQNGPPPGMTGFPPPPVQSMAFAQPPPGSGSQGTPIQLTRDLDWYSNILIGISVMFFVLCTFAITGRLLARKLVRVPLEADDFVAGVAWVKYYGLDEGEVLTSRSFC